MKNSIRKERFLRVSEKRLNRALAAIDSLKNLSSKSNYDYNKKEINHISGRLLAKVKLVMSSFGSFNAEERFQQLLDQDYIQFDLLKSSDPALYDLASKYLKNGKMYTAWLRNNKKPETDENSLINKFKDLYTELENRNLSKSSRNQNEDFFILNPEFSLDNLRARHNIDRIIWLKNGRQYKDIVASDSPYRIHPDINKRKPIPNLKWDIKRNRVIQAPNNSILI